MLFCRRRQKPQPKPHIEIPIKPERKVVSKILPVPRCNVEELLSLEAPKSSPLQTTTNIEKPVELSLDSNTQPLPPIPATPAKEKPEDTEETADGAFFMTQVSYIY